MTECWESEKEPLPEAAGMDLEVLTWVLSPGQPRQAALWLKGQQLTGRLPLQACMGEETEHDQLGSHFILSLAL